MSRKKRKICKTFKLKGCKWRLWASWAAGKRTFQIKTHQDEHICGRKNKVTLISSSWVASTYASKFKINPYMRLREIVEHVWCDWGIKISLWLAVRARKKGHALILGEYREQYGLLHRYALEILRANSNNTVNLKLKNQEFQRVYFCFEALRKGFLNGCRPFISLDGCFLKGPFDGQLLVAVGRDGNNQMFPIAWAVVEVESGDSWGWFLELLSPDLGTTSGAGYTIMSDQQKGLIQAVSEIWNQAEVRCCARHVYCNFRDVFGGGQELRKWFWRIAKSTTENVFQANIEAFRKVSEAAANDLLNRNYKKWCKAFYTPQSCCDSIDNNMSEVFNGYILNSRHKPIITMLEDISESLMERLFKKRDFIEKKECFICPRIQQKLEDNKLKSRGWSAFWDGRFKFGVRDGITQTKYVVDLRDRTCSCNTWQLSGIPCKHAIAAIWKSVEHPEQYVASSFTKSEYLKAYEFPMEPLNGPNEWPISQAESISAPPLKKVRGRPQKARKKQVGEATSNGKMRKTGMIMKCSVCGEQGHNKRSCSFRDELPSSTQPLMQLQQKGKKQTPLQTATGSSVCSLINEPRRQAAYYTDYGGEQTLQSTTVMHNNTQQSQSTQGSISSSNRSFISLNGRNYITTQALQDMANKKSGPYNHNLNQ